MQCIPWTTQLNSCAQHIQIYSPLPGGSFHVGDTIFKLYGILSVNHASLSSAYAWLYVHVYWSLWLLQLVQSRHAHIMLQNLPVILLGNSLQTAPLYSQVAPYYSLHYATYNANGKPKTSLILNVHNPKYICLDNIDLPQGYISWQRRQVEPAIANGVRMLTRRYVLNLGVVL